MLINNDLESYFESEQLLEGLLIEFEYFADQKIVLIISNIVNWSLKKDAGEFQKTVFKGVKSFERLFGANKGFLENSFHEKDYISTHVIQDIKFSQANGDFHIVFYIDNFFGGFQFLFKDLEIETKIGCGLKVGDQEWIYRDIKTNDQFDFHYPFGNLAKSINPQPLQL